VAGETHGRRLERWARKGTPGALPVAAATVILLRQGAAGLETLMLRRDSRLAFAGGMWVFPGGRVDPGDRSGLADDDELGAARQAAVREAQEEAGIDVALDALVSFSHWTPPPITPKRFLTWFFVAAAPTAEVVIDDGEIREHAWLSPTEVLRRRDTQEIELAPPTWVTLHELARAASVREALDAARGREPERFVTRIAVDDNGPMALWHGDAGYEDADPTRPGPRHRLHMRDERWIYERSD
jgi:8-oxo-dGTP pyrophosphatase MutT (NUDIX family)